MKKLTFSLLFFTAIAWLWIGRMMGADGYLYNSAGNTTTVSGGGSPPAGLVMTNKNVNAFTVFTNNQVSAGFDSSGLFIHTNYAAANLGFSVNTNGAITGGRYTGTDAILTLATLYWGSGGTKGRINVPSSGVWTFYDNTDLDFGRVQLGGTTEAYPSIKRSGGNIAISDGPGTGTTNSLIVPGTITATNGYNFVGATTLCTLTNVVYTNSTLDFGSTAATSFSDLLVPIANLKSNDVGTINVPAIAQTNGMFTLWISNTTCYARYHNIQATAVNPASGIYNIQVFQYK